MPAHPRIPMPDVDETPAHRAGRDHADRLLIRLVRESFLPPKAARRLWGIGEELPVVPAPDVVPSPLAAAQGFPRVLTQPPVYPHGPSFSLPAGWIDEKLEDVSPAPLFTRGPAATHVELDEVLDAPRPRRWDHRYAITKGGEVVERGAAEVLDGTLYVPTALKLDVGDSITIDPAVDPAALRELVQLLRPTFEPGNGRVDFSTAELGTGGTSTVESVEPTSYRMAKRPSRRKLARKIDKLKVRLNRQAFAIADRDRLLDIRQREVDRLDVSVHALTAELEAALRLPHPAEGGWPDRVIDVNGRVWARVLAPVRDGGSAFWQSDDEPGRYSTLGLYGQRGPIRRPREGEL